MTSPSPGDRALALVAHREGDVLVVSPRGRIDHESAESFKGALAPHLDACRPDRPLLLDLGGVDYVASVGLRVLMLASRQAKAQGGTIAVAGLTPLVREIFDISKFTLVFRCYPSVADAVTALAGGRGPGTERP
jgi:anti-sigma B factor antagonist/stage II sporulation protein AA (anti-sigma F factor antagonist)